MRFLLTIEEGLILIFVETKRSCDYIEDVLCGKGFPACSIHGDKTQREREQSLKSFRGGHTPVMVATDVAARGLDIPSVDVVINFDLPGHGKDYIHRVGRTARAGRSGKAIAMVTQYDVEIYQRLEGLLGKKLPECKLDEETVLILLERVNEAQRLATRELKEQLAGCKGSGGIRKRRGTGGGGGMEVDMRKEIQKGYYAGGSGGRGGALPNQRGSGSQKKRKY